jgi:O-antigen/teichoic acid export membrane protein
MRRFLPPGIGAIRSQHLKGNKLQSEQAPTRSIARHGLIYKNALMLFASQLNQGLSYLYAIIVGRLRGPEFYGTLSYAFSLNAMLSVVALLGMQALLVREVSKNKDKAPVYVTSALIIGLASTALTIVGGNLAVLLFEKDQSLRLYVGLLTLGFLLSYTESILSAVFMALEKMQPILYERTVWNVVRVAGTVGLLLMGAGLLSVVVMWLVATLVSALYCIYLYVKHIGPIQLRVDREMIVHLIKRCPVFLLTNISTTLSWQADMLILRFMTDFTQVGLYVSAYRILEATFLVPQAYLMSASSQLSRFTQERDDSYRDLGRTMLKNMSVYAFVCVAVIVAYPYFPVLLLGKKFLGSAPVLRILILMLIPYVFTKVFACILVAAERQTLDLVSNVARTVISISLNVILIPRYGSRGAAFSAVAAMCALCALEAFFARDLLRNLRMGSSIALSLGLSIGAALLTLLLVRIPILLIPVSIIMAGVLMYVLRRRRVRTADVVRTK